MMTIFRSFLVTMAAFVTASLAWAADPFTVAGVPVDATGATAIEAQTTAMLDGQAMAAQVLLDRLTLRQERQKKGFRAQDLDSQTIQRMIRALEVANEKRSANRYLGDITVAFNPSQVQQVLQSQGLTMVSTQSRPRLVLPLLPDRPLWSDHGWSEALRNGAYTHSLTPLRTIGPEEGTASVLSASQARSLDMDALRSLGARYGLEQLLVADAVTEPGGVRVRLTDVALDTGQKRSLGTVRGGDFERAALSVVEKLETDWKQAAFSLAENAEVMTVSVLYRSHEDWLRLQEAINSSAQIQDARLDALSRDGALMTLTYGGDMGRLKNELAFKGVQVRSDPDLGVVLTRSRRR